MYVIYRPLLLVSFAHASSAASNRPRGRERRLGVFVLLRPEMRPVIVLAAVALLTARRCSAQCVVTIAGPLNVEGAPATAMQLSNPFGIAVDGAGGFFFADNLAHNVRHVFSNASMFLAAGTMRSPAFSGDGGAGTAARLNGPAGLSSDGAGGVIVADRLNHAIRRIYANGSIVTIAGSGASGTPLGDGGPATQAKLNQPYSAALDAFPALGGNGGMFVCDSANHVIR